MQPDLIIGNIKQFALECESILLNESLRPDGIVIVLLLVVHVSSIAEVLLDEPFIMPIHIIPAQWNIWVFAEPLRRILFLPISYLVLLYVMEDAVNEKPVAGSESNRIAVIVREEVLRYQGYVLVLDRVQLADFGEDEVQGDGRDDEEGQDVRRAF